MLAQLIVGLATLGALMLWESRGHGKPLIPFRLFRGQRVVGLCFALAAMAGINYYVVLNMGPTIIQTAFTETRLGYGALGLGPGLGLVVGAVLGNILASAIGEYSREFMTVGAVLMSMNSSLRIYRLIQDNLTFDSSFYRRSGCDHPRKCDNFCRHQYVCRVWHWYRHCTLLDARYAGLVSLIGLLTRCRMEN